MVLLKTLTMFEFSKNYSDYINKICKATKVIFFGTLENKILMFLKIHNDVANN